MALNITEPSQDNLGLLDHIPLGAFMLREDFTITFWNNCLEDWTGIQSDTIIGARIFDLFPHFSNPEYSKRIESILAGGPPAVFSAQLHGYIIPVPGRNDGYRAQHTTATQIKMSDGSIHALFIIQDVTEEKSGDRQDT